MQEIQEFILKIQKIECALFWLIFSFFKHELGTYLFICLCQTIFWKNLNLDNPFSRYNDKSASVWVKFRCASAYMPILNLY